MGATFSRYKNWISLENLTDEDLNAEFNKILNNLTPTGVDDHSPSVAQMRLETNPGSSGTESLATSLAGELQRLRYKLRQILGSTYWYDPVVVSLTEANTLLNQVSGLPANRIVSCVARSATSNQAAFLVPSGSTNNITLDGTPTNFIYRVDGTQYTIATDAVATGLTLAPSSNNTALINDADAVDQAETRYWGEWEVRKTLIIDTVGTEISNLVGKYAAFSLYNGTDTEYFVAYVKSATELTNIYRGYFFNSSGTPVKRVVFSNNDVITLMKLTNVFALTTGALFANYTNIAYAATAPSSPASDDVWFDTVNKTYKKFTGGSFVALNGIHVGYCIQTTTATVGARSLQPYATYVPDAMVKLVVDSNTVIRTDDNNSYINVAGNVFNPLNSKLTWDITANLAGSEDMYNATEQASTFYYVYTKDTGHPILSDIEPYYLPQQFGWYHPHNSTWRAVGIAFNNGSSNLIVCDSYSVPRSAHILHTGDGHGSTNNKIRKYTTVGQQIGSAIHLEQSATSGDDYYCMIPMHFSFEMSDTNGANFETGITLNTTVPTTAIGAGTVPQTEILAYTGGSSVGQNLSVSLYLKRGDKVRIHDDGVVAGTTQFVRFLSFSLGPLFI